MQARLADDFTHHRFGDLFDGFRRVLHVQDEVLGVLGIHLPEDGELDIDDILVLRQHQALFEIFADLGFLAVLDFHQNMLLNRGGQVEMQAGAEIGLPFSEAEHGCLLRRIDHDDAGREPAQQGYTDENDEAERAEIRATAAAATTAATAATAGALAESLLHTLHLLLEVAAAIAAGAGSRARPGRAGFLAGLIV